MSGSDATRILSAVASGDPSAPEQLLPLVYVELRKLAAARLAQERPGQTLQATALVHEAYLRLVDVDQVQAWHGRGHFFAAAANAMHRILVENARRRKSHKGGGHAVRQELDPDQIGCAAREDLLALDEALSRLAKTEPKIVELVKLRYFAGLTISEASEVLGVSPRTVDAWWAYARAWLRTELQSDGL